MLEVHSAFHHYHRRSNISDSSNYYNNYSLQPPVTSQHIDYVWSQLGEYSPPLPPSSSSSSSSPFDGGHAMQHLRFPTPPVTPPRGVFVGSLAVPAPIHNTVASIADTVYPTVPVQRTQSVIMKIPSTVARMNADSPSYDRESTTSSPSNNSSNSSSNGDYLCEWLHCKRYFESLDALAAHVTQIHAVSEPADGLYYCRWRDCQRSERGFNARYKMLVHARTHTKEKPHTCQLCSKSFSRAENLKIHVRSHSGEKPYVCIYAGCNKSYSNSSDRFKHTRTHAVDKPYACKMPGCQKRYTDPSSLRKHVKTFKHTASDASSSSTQPTAIKQVSLSSSPPPLQQTPAMASTPLSPVHADFGEFVVSSSNSSSGSATNYWPYGSTVPAALTLHMDTDHAEMMGLDGGLVVPLDLRVHRR